MQKYSLISLLTVWVFTAALPLSFGGVPEMPELPKQIAQVFPANTSEGQPAPGVLLVHGGGWSGGNPSVLEPLAEKLADQGITGILVKYRLAASGTSSLLESAEDVEAALAFVVKHAQALNIDPERIWILGESAGGHLASMVLQRSSRNWNLRGAILVNPVLDLPATAWTKNHAGMPPTMQPNISDELEIRRLLSPQHLPTDNLPPVFLLHGDKDQIVSAEQSRAFAEKLRTAELPVELEILKDVDHAFLIPGYGSPEVREAAEKQILQWILEKNP